MTEPLDLRAHGAGVHVLTFNRPRVRNAINSESIAALSKALGELEADPTLRGLVVTGAGGAFVAGGDIKEMRGAHDRQSGEVFSRAMGSNLSRLSRLPVPVIAAIEGPALGGGMEIALSCDLRVVADTAQLSFRQVHMALSPGWGGGQRLVTLVGPARALRLLWKGDDLGAAEALAQGLADDICPSGAALKTALELASELAGRAPMAVSHIKKMVQGAAERSHEQAQDRERELFLDLWSSADHDEAVNAFFDRRQSQWSQNPRG